MSQGLSSWYIKQKFPLEDNHIANAATDPESTQVTPLPCIHTLHLLGLFGKLVFTHNRDQEDRQDVVYKVWGHKEANVNNFRKRL